MTSGDTETGVRFSGNKLAQLGTRSLCCVIDITVDVVSGQEGFGISGLKSDCADSVDISGL